MGWPFTVREGALTVALVSLAAVGIIALSHQSTPAPATATSPAAAVAPAAAPPGSSLIWAQDIVDSGSRLQQHLQSVAQARTESDVPALKAGLANVQQDSEDLRTTLWDYSAPHSPRYKGEQTSETAALIEETSSAANAVADAASNADYQCRSGAEITDTCRSAVEDALVAWNRLVPALGAWDALAPVASDTHGATSEVDREEVSTPEVREPAAGSGFDSGRFVQACTDKGNAEDDCVVAGEAFDKMYRDLDQATR